MASNFITDISHYGKKFTITFTTDNKEHYNRVLETARECIDDGSVNLHLRKQAKPDDNMLQIFGLHSSVPVKAKCMCEEYVKRYKDKTSNLSMFIKIEDGNGYTIVYHSDTKVMYAISEGYYNTGTFTVMLNADGTPMLWEDTDERTK